MGNCLITIIGIENFPLIENSDSMMHLIESNKESLQKLNDNFREYEDITNKNLSAISEDLIYLNKKVHSFESFNHQSSSKYGGNSSVSMQADDDGPDLISSDISEYSSARR